MKLPFTKQEKDFQDFQEWINPSNSPLLSQKEDSWDKLLILYASDENKAFNSFFIKLEKFKKRHQPKEDFSAIEISKESKVEYLKRCKSLKKESGKK